jgi:glycerophosphoryl diester phosphodiesterase
MKLILHRHGSFAPDFAQADRAHAQKLPVFHRGGGERGQPARFKSWREQLIQAFRRAFGQAAQRPGSKRGKLQKLSSREVRQARARRCRRAICFNHARILRSSLRTVKSPGRPCPVKSCSKSIPVCDHVARMNFRATALCLLTLSAAFAARPLALAADAATWNVRDHVPLKDFIIQSHRGAGELAEENTLDAFELGWKLGTYPESDLRTTKDGVIVAFHDDNFKRVVKGISPEMAAKGVADVTFAELSKLDVGSWKGDDFKGRHVSKITEVFARMKGKPERHLYLDIKNVRLPQLAAEVKQFGVEKQIILATPKHAVIKEWKTLVPESDTLLWVGGEEKKQRKQIAEVRAANYAGITQLQIHTHVAPDAKSFTPDPAWLTEMSKELAARHIVFQTLPYGGSSAEIYSRLLDLGLASFATDHPDITLKAVRDYYARKPID